MWCRAAVPCKHSLTKALGTPHKPRVKSPCGKVCLGMVLGTTGGNPIYTEMNCQPPLHFHEEGFPTVFTLVKKSDTCENLHFLHVQIVIDQCVNTFSALWECNVYKNTLSKIVSCIPQAIFFSFFSFFSLFFVKSNLCRVKGSEARMQKHNKPIFTVRYLGRMKLGHRWGALLCVCKLISPRALLRRAHLDSQHLQHNLGQTQEILFFLLSLQCTPALNTFYMQWAYTKPSCSAGKACMRKGFLQDVSL